MGLKIKICGMKHAANIASVAPLEPDYMGFIFYAKSPRFVSDIVAELIRYVPRSIKTTGVFVNEDLETVQAFILKYQLRAVQLHGNETVAYCEALKLTGAEVIKAFGIDQMFDFLDLAPYVGAVDYFLFDTRTPVHGGSGKLFDWTLLENYQYDKPYFLSGGIDLVHVGEIKHMNDPRLNAIDINSKFELEPGVKDVEKLRTFMAELRE